MTDSSNDCFHWFTSVAKLLQKKRASFCLASFYPKQDLIIYFQQSE